MPTLYRVQAVLKHADSLMRDAVTNTFHVLDNSDTPVAAEPVAEAVRNFYTAAPAGQAGALFNYFGAQVATNGHEVRVYRYNIADGARIPYEGAPPDHVEPFDLLGRGTPDASLASEVAVCITLANTSVGAVPAARRRGRVYIGGLDTGCTAQVSGVARPSAAFRDQLNDCAVQLVNDLDALTFGLDAGLVVYSRPYAGRGANEAFRANGTPLPALPARAGATYHVDSVSVDDAFDTQRRRGERATV